MKEVLLVFPDPSSGIKPERKFIPSNRIVPPVQYLFLAPPLEKAGYKVRMIDCRVNANYTDQIKALLKNVIFVGITSMTGPQIKEGIFISKFIKKINKDVPIIWGGIHPTIFPIQTLSNENIDIVVKNEGEEIIVELANALSNKDSNELKKIKGICFKLKGKIYDNGIRNYFINLKNLSIPAWHLINNTKGTEYMFRFFTSRGCMHNCYFCYNKAYHHRKYRANSAKNVIKEIDYARSLFGFNSIQFGDDDFLIDKDRAREIFNELYKRKIQVEWFQTKETNLSENLIPYFLKTKSKEIGIGIESGSERILKLTNKKISLKRLVNIKRILTKCGIKTSHGFMIGFPFETDEDLKESVRLAKKLKKIDPGTRMGVSIFVPYPGTELYTYIKSKYNIKEPKKLEEWAKTDPYGNININLIPWVKNSLFYKNFQVIFENLFSSNKISEGLTESILKRSNRLRLIFNA